MTSIFTIILTLFEELGLRIFLGKNISENEYSKLASFTILEETDIYILEKSSFQLKSIFKSRHLIYAIVNLEIDHLDWYESLEDYWNSKLKFLEIAKYICKVGETEIIKEIPQFFLKNFSSEHNFYNLSLIYIIPAICSQKKELEIPSDLLNRVVLNFSKQKFFLQFRKEIKINSRKIEVYKDSKSIHYLSLRSNFLFFEKTVIPICCGLTRDFVFLEIKDKVDIKIIANENKKILVKSFKEKRIFLTDIFEKSFEIAMDVVNDNNILLFSQGMFSLIYFKTQISGAKLLKS